MVKESQEVVVDRLEGKENGEIPLEILATFDEDKKAIELGKPVLEEKGKAKLIKHFKGEKIRVARFKSKVRYRKVRGFRPSLSLIKIIKI